MDMELTGLLSDRTGIVLSEVDEVHHCRIWESGAKVTLDNHAMVCSLSLWPCFLFHPVFLLQCSLAEEKKQIRDLLKLLSHLCLFSSIKGL